MSKFTFSPNSITCEGISRAAGYSVTPSGSVMVFVTLPGTEEPARIRFAPDHPDHAAALAAARGEILEQPAPATESAEEPAQDPTPAEHPAPATDTTEQPAQDPALVEQAAPTQDPKQARAPVPEKTFIGQTITGRGWRIYFDGETSRTRVIFDADPSAEEKKAVEAAGFYYSPNLNSYNKKLTHKAHRAALALCDELRALSA